MDIDHGPAQAGFSPSPAILCWTSTLNLDLDLVRQLDLDLGLPHLPWASSSYLGMLVAQSM